MHERNNLIIIIISRFLFCFLTGIETFSAPCWFCRFMQTKNRCSANIQMETLFQLLCFIENFIFKLDHIQKILESFKSWRVCRAMFLKEWKTLISVMIHRCREPGHHLWVFSLGVEDLSRGRPEGLGSVCCCCSRSSVCLVSWLLIWLAARSRSSLRTWRRWRPCPGTKCCTSWRRASRSWPSPTWSTSSTCGRTRALSSTMCWSSFTWRGYRASWSSTSTHCQKVGALKKKKGLGCLLLFVCLQPET